MAPQFFCFFFCKTLMFQKLRMDNLDLSLQHTDISSAHAHLVWHSVSILIQCKFSIWILFLSGNLQWLLFHWCIHFFDNDVLFCNKLWSNEKGKWVQLQGVSSKTTAFLQNDKADPLVNLCLCSNESPNSENVNSFSVSGEPHWAGPTMPRTLQVNNFDKWPLWPFNMQHAPCKKQMTAFKLEQKSHCHTAAQTHWNRTVWIKFKNYTSMLPCHSRAFKFQSDTQANDLIWTGFSFSRMTQAQLFKPDFEVLEWDNHTVLSKQDIDTSTLLVHCGSPWVAQHSWGQMCHFHCQMLNCCHWVGGTWWTVGAHPMTVIRMENQRTVGLMWFINCPQGVQSMGFWLWSSGANKKSDCPMQSCRKRWMINATGILHWGQPDILKFHNKQQTNQKHWWQNQNTQDIVRVGFLVAKCNFDKSLTLWWWLHWAVEIDIDSGTLSMLKHWKTHSLTKNWCTLMVWLQLNSHSLWQVQSN